MAQKNYEDYMESLGEKKSANSFRENSAQVGFFSLKNDGDEAIVRICLDDTKDLDFLTTHQITLDGRFRRVNCLRESAMDDIGKCPLCNSGLPIQNRIFIKLLKYDVVDGTVVANPVVWERPASFGATLRTFIQEYGPLSDCILKIKRRGAAGDRSTSYDVLFVNQALYPEDKYKKDFSAFTNLKILGRFVLDKTAEELEGFVNTGSFPEKVAPTSTEHTTNNSNQFSSAQTSVPQADTAVRRPTRYY